MALLFDVELDVVREEKPEYKNEVTEHAVEDGEEIADHVRRLPRTLTITATIAGPDWETRYERLRELADSKEVGTYVGLEVWENMVMERFDPSRTVHVANGVRFTLLLKQVRVARVETRSFVAPDPVTQSEAEFPPRERGLQQPEVKEMDEETATSWVVALGRRVGILPPETEADEVQEVA